MNPPLPSESINEDLRKEFEQRWLRGKPGKIENYLPPANDPCYLGTLEELVHIEIELAWKQRIHDVQDRVGGSDQTTDQPAPIESYLVRFTNLDNPEILARLLKQECLVRKQVGMPLSKEMCQTRFPDLDLQQAGILPYLDFHSSDSSDTPGATLAPEDPGDETITLPLHFADYELLEEIGRGSMGIVYRSKQISNPRIVAIKILRTKLLDTSSDGAINRFQQEIKAAAKLRHENIVCVFDVNKTKGHHFFSMQYVRGKSLAEMTLRRPIENQAAAKYLEQVARAIHYAHRSGILHRDLKPANILIDDDTDRPLVADFGLAKISGQGHSITSIGETVGTPSFMSPEQVRDAAEVTEQSDVYSLGATLYSILSGKPPFFAARSSETLRQLIEEYPVPLRQLNTNVDRDLETICMKCMRKKPSLRYASADELANDLECYLSGKKIRARPHVELSKVFRSVNRNHRLLIAGIISAALLIGGSITLSYRFFISANSNANSIERMVKAEDVVSIAVRDLIDEQSTIITPNSASEKKTLEQFLRYYSSLVASAQNKTTDSQVTAMARLQMARIETSLGNLKVAERLLRTTIRHLGEGTSPTAKSTGFRLGLMDPHSAVLMARTWFSLGIVDQRMGNIDRAMKDFQHASEFLDYLMGAFPNRTDVQLLAADNYVKMGQLALTRRRWAPAKKYFDGAIRWYQQLLEQPQPHSAAFMGIARCYKYRSEGEQLQGNQRGYRQYLEASYQELEQIVETPEYVPTIKTIRPLMMTCRDLGNAYAAATIFDALHAKTAILWYEKAFRLSQKLPLSNDPTGTYQALKADILIGWAASLSAVGRDKEALDKCQIALKIWQPINEQHPNNPTFVCQRAVAMGQLARVQINLGNVTEAREDLTRAKQMLSKLLRKYPGKAQFSTELEKILRLLQQLES